MVMQPRSIYTQRVCIITHSSDALHYAIKISNCNLFTELHVSAVIIHYKPVVKVITSMC